MSTDEQDARTPRKRAHAEPHGDEIDLTPEDEAALDVAWAVIVEREKREREKAGAQ
jgi:hypothetical protein